MIRARWLAMLALLGAGCATGSPSKGTPAPDASAAASPSAGASTSSSQAAGPTGIVPLAGPTARSPAAGGKAQAGGDDSIDAMLEALHVAGDEQRCDKEVARVRAALAASKRYSTEQLEQELRSRDTKGKGPMPYPSPGTACAIFGVQRALSGAIDDRRAK